jgi:molecular chaperone DnaK
VRESLTSESIEEINAKTEALNTAMTKASEQIYAAAESEASAEGEGETPDEDDEVVDAEVVDEGDDK